MRPKYVVALLLAIVSGCSNPGRLYAHKLQKVRDVALILSGVLDGYDPLRLQQVRAMPDTSYTAIEFCDKYAIPLSYVGREACKDYGKDIMVRRVGTVLMVWSFGLNEKNDDGGDDDLVKIVRLDIPVQRWKGGSVDRHPN